MSNKKEILDLLENLAAAEHYHEFFKKNGTKDFLFIRPSGNPINADGFEKMTLCGDVIDNYSEEQHDGIVFNVNIPNLPLNEIKGISLTRLGNRGIPLAPEFKGSETKISYKIGKSGEPNGDLSGTDFEAIKNGKVSVTPLFWDMTNHSKLKGQLPDV